MTDKTNKTDNKPGTVELNDAALDRAAGGGFTGGIRVASADINNDGAVRTITTDGTTKSRT